MASFLHGDDLSRLVEAMLGYAPSMRVRAQLMAVPAAVRSEWLTHHVLRAFRAFLNSVASVGLFHAREVMVVHAMVDWSPFADAPPLPVAEYAWHASAEPRVVLHEPAIHKCLLRCVRRRLPQVHVALYAVLLWSGQSILCPTPLHRTSHDLFPHFCV